MLERLLALQEWGRPLINKGRAAASYIMGDESRKKEIDALYKYYFGRAVTGCKNCYADALIQLCTLKKSIAMDKTESFVLRRGKVLRDIINHDARLNLVRGNETEELALYHLYTNPRAREFFETLPDDETLDAMIAEYGEKYEAQRTEQHGGEAITVAKTLNDAHDEADKIVADAKAEAAEISRKADEDKIALLGEAQTEADKIVADAKAEAAEIVKAAKAEAKAVKKAAAKDDPIMS